MIKEKFTVDLSRFIGLTGKLIPGVAIELKLIEYFSQVESDESNAIDKFTTYLLKYLYKDDVVRPYSEITTFYKEKEYVHVVMYFLDMLEIFLLSKTDPNVLNIHFIAFEVKTDEKIIGVFESWLPGEQKSP